MKPLDWGLPSRAVLDVLELKEQLIWVTVRTAAELAAVVAEHGLHTDPVLIEERQHVVMHHLHRRERELARVEPASGVAAEAIEHGLQVHLADPLQRSDEERVHGDEVARDGLRELGPRRSCV